MRSFHHLHLSTARTRPLVEDEQDWEVLGRIAQRMLFWCGGAIHGVRCEGCDMRFAIQSDHAAIGSMVHHISGAFAVHLRRRRGWSGGVFRHYCAIPIDGELFLDDLVLWLHRPPAAAGSCWTADEAYLKPKSMSWITTDTVLSALSPGGAGRSAYRRRRTQDLSAQTLAILTGDGTRRGHSEAAAPAAPNLRQTRPSIERIAHFVADYTHVSYEDMRSTTRRRAVTRAKIVAAVLAARQGVSVAEAARLFKRSRSTMSERAERYRRTQPQLFAQAERALGAYLTSTASGKP